MIYLAGRGGWGQWLPFFGQSRHNMAQEGTGRESSGGNRVDGPKALRIAKEWTGPKLVQWAQEVRSEQVQIDVGLLADNPENFHINVQDAEGHTNLRPGSGNDPWLIQFIGVKGAPPRRYVFYVLIDSRNGEIIHVGVAGGGAGELK